MVESEVGLHVCAMNFWLSMNWKSDSEAICFVPKMQVGQEDKNLESQPTDKNGLVISTILIYGEVFIQTCIKI